MIKTKIIRDNRSQEVEVFVGLKAGDEIECIKSVDGLGGDFIAFPMTLLKRGKKYKVNHLSNWSFYGEIPWVLDEDACCTWVTTEHFKIV